MDTIAAVLSWWLDSSCPLAGLPSLRATKILLLYVGSIALAGVILPGRKIQGTVLSDGSRKEYKCNGLLVLVILLSVFFGAARLDLSSVTVIADLGGELFVTTLLGSFILSVYLYITGKLSKATSASLKPNSHGNFIYDFWFGVQLNPSLLGQDLKFFCLRPGMMGWLFLNLAIAAKQLQTDGSLPLSAILYQIFTGIYVVDYFVFEEYMTSTWDIIAEDFGFMLVFGDLIWIPFTFSIQAWWLLKHPVQISTVYGTAATILFVLGFVVFRGANRQKHIFKHYPSAPIWGRPPKVIGGRLLASGFWGVSRHSNYAGDLLLALSYSLPCGFTSPLPYFYFIYLFVLLIWRERRDEQRCRAKYKEKWEEYCKAVPWRIFPYIY